MKTIKYLFFLIILSLETSCITQKDLLLKRIRPAEYTFSNEIKRVLLVNNLYNTESTKLENNSILQNAQNQIFDTFVQEVIHQNYFDSIHIINQIEPLALIKIAEDNYPQADAILSISNLRTYLLQNSDDYLPTIALKGEIDLNILDLEDDNKISKILISDTLYIDQYSYQFDNTEHNLELLEEITKNLTYRLISKILPYQIEENRTIFSWSDINTRDARRYLLKGKIRYSEIIWKELLKETSKPLYKAYLYSNLSFISENENQLDRALHYIKSAQKEIVIKNNKKEHELSSYLKTIETTIIEKKHDQEILKKQFRK